MRSTHLPEELDEPVKIVPLLPLVSIILPCRNEEKFIARCLDSIVANDFPKESLEILVVDGMSQDGTREILAGYTRRYQFIRLLDNPRKITPVALNIAIANAKGEIIMRMDAHATYDDKYISKCVKMLDQHNADNVGGIWRIIPRTNTLIGQAIVKSLSHKFGIGNAYYRIANEEKPRQVDTVPFFCLRKQVFQQLGLFNEDLLRGQDMEFNLRLKKAGGRTFLVPDIVSYYYARSDMKSFLKHNWCNGVWAILPFAYSNVMPVSWRHLVPLVFVSVLTGSSLVAFVWPFSLLGLLATASIYTAANLAASAHIAWRDRDIRYILVMPTVFASLHLCYGLGSLWGLVKLAGHTVSRVAYKVS